MWTDWTGGTVGAGVLLTGTDAVGAWVAGVPAGTEGRLLAGTGVAVGIDGFWEGV
jgi:hypothetical protein